MKVKLGRRRFLREPHIFFFWPERVATRQNFNLFIFNLFLVHTNNKLENIFTYLTLMWYSVHLYYQNCFLLINHVISQSFAII